MKPISSSPAEWTDRVSGGVKQSYDWLDPERTVLERLEPHRTILEIGSGKGRYTQLNPRVVGLEYSRPFLEYCREHVKGFFLRGDGFQLPIRDNTFDCVFSSGVVEHYDDPAAMVREHVRVCRPGGTVIVTVPARDSWDGTSVILRQEILGKGEKSDWHYYGRRMPDREMESILRDAGLVDIDLTHLGVPLRVSPGAFKGYLRYLFRDRSLDRIKGAMLEIVARILAHPIFRFVTGDAVHRRYSKTHGYYLLAQGTKPSPELDNEAASPPIQNFGDLYKLLMCPRCGNAMAASTATIVCTHCDTSYPIENEVPMLTPDDGVPASSVS